LKPLRYALLLALSYLLVAGAYILVSSRLAAAIASNVAELQRIEQFKGIVFVVVTGLLLFFAAWFLFRRFAQDETARALERRAMALMQSKAYSAELAAAVAHDFNNLLLVIHAGVDELSVKCREPSSSNTLEAMRSALDSARDLTKRMARAARGERAARQEPRCLATLVKETWELLQRIPRFRGRKVEVITSTNAKAVLDPVLVEQILVNLLLNAADAAGDGGKVLVEVRADEESVYLSVQDNGEGLTGDALTNAFKPFTTSKSQGLGLGLLSVRASVEASQGTLVVRSSRLGGAQFDVSWPIAK
jgi:two-component system sensor histidine kinase HydH